MVLFDKVSEDSAAHGHLDKAAMLEICLDES